MLATSRRSKGGFFESEHALVREVRRHACLVRSQSADADGVSELHVRLWINRQCNIFG